MKTIRNLVTLCLAVLVLAGPGAASSVLPRARSAYAAPAAASAVEREAALPQTRFLKNWLYDQSVSWFNTVIATGAENQNVRYAVDSDAIILEYENAVSEVSIWCNPVDPADRDIRGYQYLVFDVVNNGWELPFGVMATEGADQPKEHFFFKNVYLRPRSVTRENQTVAAVTEWRFMTVPAGFDGYIVMPFPNVESTMWGETNDGHLDLADFGSVDLFLKAGTSGNLTIMRPFITATDEILDTTLPVGMIVDLGEYSAAFRVVAEHKTYDGQPAAANAGLPFTAQWYAVKEAETPLSQAPTDAGLYKVVARARDYPYVSETYVFIYRAAPDFSINAPEDGVAGGVVDTATVGPDGTPGTLTVFPKKLEEGDNQVEYVFTPTDTVNYKSVSGTFTVKAVAGRRGCGGLAGAAGLFAALPLMIGCCVLARSARRRKV